MASCVTSLVLLFAFIGEVTGSCIDTDEDNAVPVCTDCSKTGKVVLIDTSMVPRNANVICSCEIATSGTPTNLTIAYHELHYSICRIAFEFMSYNLPCETNGSVSVEGISEIRFRKTNYIGNAPAANLSITVEQPNATVTVMCRNIIKQPNATSVPLYVTTARTVSQIEQSTLQSSPAESSSTITATTSIPVTQSTLTTPSTPTNKTTLARSRELGTKKDNQTVIIAGACGGASGILLLVLVTLLLLYLFRSRLQKTNTAIPSKVSYFSSASGCEATENVVYNMEFVDETKCAHDPLDEADVTHKSVQRDTQKQSDETNTVVTYQNLHVDNYDEKFNTKNLDLEPQKNNKPTVTQLNSMQLDEDGGAYNTVDCKITNDAQSKQDNKMHHSSKIESYPLYDIVGLNKNAKTSIKINYSISTQNQAAYAVVNKNKSNNIGHERPKQFQIPESGDTYALVNKES